MESMDRAEVLALLQRVEQLGIEFYIGRRAIDGQSYAFLDADTVLRCLLDGLKAEAASVGLSAHDFEAWIDSGGRVRCMAKTAKGRQCKCYVPGVRFRDAKAWMTAEKAGGYCGVHSGV